MDLKDKALCPSHLGTPDCVLCEMDLESKNAKSESMNGVLQMTCERKQ